jgi:hypothetical protein
MERIAIKESSFERETVDTLIKYQSRMSQDNVTIEQVEYGGKIFLYPKETKDFKITDEDITIDGNSIFKKRGMVEIKISY